MSGCGRCWSPNGAAPPGVRGRIPAFFCTQEAADRLAELPEWQLSKIVKAVPDTAQQPVRARALREGKLVYMAVPKLDVRVAGSFAQPHSTVKPVDLIVCGSVAVNHISPDEAASKNTAMKIGRKVDVDDMSLPCCGKQD